MKKLFLTSACLSSLLATASINAAIDDNASSVTLNKSCTINSINQDNCFTSYNSLKNWISSKRKPDESTPLEVNIGPGTFEGTPAPDINLTCNPAEGFTGYIAFNGAGSKQSILKGTGSPSASSINIKNCTHLNFTNLKVETNFYGGIYWSGGGQSKWVDVEVDTMARAWAEPVCGAERGQHYWYSSKISATAIFSIALPYSASCDETWFFGSEIKVTVPESQTGNNGGGAVVATDQGIIHVYGSNLRSFLDGGSNAAINLVPAASASNGGEIHIHGTGIDVISETGQDVVALDASNGGFIHADASAYVMKTSGSKTRINNNGGTIKAAYQWSQNNQPPSVTSATGSDLAVETSCDPSGCHEVDTGTETHLLILNNSCDYAGHGPWFDVVTGKCRGDMSIN
ncbi:MAG: hypothetical protein OQK46_09545 [Gammaproteobacteria bacterium]|nr:hypothetical protein [Gammaproteobacteria bacterium]